MDIANIYFRPDIDEMLINPFMNQDEVKAYKVKCVAPTIKMKKS